MHAGEASLDAAPGEDVYEQAWKEPFQKVAPFSTATQHEVLPTGWLDASASAASTPGSMAQ
jgi:hypothetical protein